MTCPNCGGFIVGDGCTVAFHCENVELPLDTDPDAEIIYCDVLYDTPVCLMTYEECWDYLNQ